MASWQVTRTNPSRRQHACVDGGLAVVLLQIVDLGLWAIIFIGPHLFGGRHPLGRFAILSLCVITAFAWFARQLWIKKPRRHSTSAIGLLVVATSWVAFQLVPLPYEWLNQLAPQIRNILPLWNVQNTSSVSLGTWQTISLCPEETRLALAALIAYGLLFITVVERLETMQDIKRLIRWVGLSACIVACFGIVQYFTANGNFFWFYNYPYSDTRGVCKAGFTSRNHFAHFLILGLSAIVASVVLDRHAICHHKSSNWQRSRDANNQNYSSGLLLTFGGVVIAFAILASLSRGGLLAMGAAAVVLTLIYAKVGLFNSGHVLIGGLLVIVVIMALSITGTYEKLAQRVDSLSSSSLEVVDSGGGRRSIWQANLAAIRAGWLTGSGAGTHRFIYHAYINQSFSTEFTHAENGYLQVATENGLPGVLLLAATMLIVFSWCVRTLFNANTDSQTYILAGGITAALIASAVHSVVDFVWFIPACMSVTVLLVGCMMRLYQLSHEQHAQFNRQYPVSQIANFNFALGTGIAGLWVVMTLVPLAQTSLTWDDCTRARLANESLAKQDTGAWQHLQQELKEAESMNAATELNCLRKMARDYPASATTHSQLACALLKQFEIASQENGNAMALGQVREAAQASQFASAQELRKWLQVAFGESSDLLYQAYFHARCAIRHCPLQSEAYICLAELCFLEKHASQAYYAYAEQALRVNPLNPMHLFGVGKNYFIADEREKALRLWRGCFATNGPHQQYIIGILVQELPAEQFLREFNPSWSTLQMLWQAYEACGAREDLQAIKQFAENSVRLAAPALSSGQAGKAWHMLAIMKKKLDDPQGALQCLQQAYAVYPDSILIRRELANSLIDIQQFELAESHLRWCDSQIPNHPGISDQLAQAIRGRMEKLARISHTTHQ